MLGCAAVTGRRGEGESSGAREGREGRGGEARRGNLTTGRVLVCVLVEFTFAFLPA